MADEVEKEQPQPTAEGEEKTEEKPEEKKEHLEKQPEQETMRSIVLTGYGGYNKLQVQKYAKPKPMNGQVVVRVHAWWVTFNCLFNGDCCSQLFICPVVRGTIKFPLECNYLDPTKKQMISWRVGNNSCR